MSSPAERRYVNAKLSLEELTVGVRRWPFDKQLRWRLRLAKQNFNVAREDLHVERFGRRR